MLNRFPSCPEGSADPYAPQPPPGGWLGRLAVRCIKAIRAWEDGEFDREQSVYRLASQLLPSDLGQCDSHDFDRVRSSVRQFGRGLGRSTIVINRAVQFVDEAERGQEAIRAGRCDGINPDPAVSATRIADVAEGPQE